MLNIQILIGSKMDNTTPSIYIDELYMIIAELRDRLIDHGDMEWLEDMAEQHDFDLYS